MNVPKLRFPEFAGKWQEKPLGDVATFSKGKGISKADISPKGTTPCIRYGELYTHYGTRIDEVLSATDVPVSELKLSQGGEVIVPASGEDAKDIATAAVVLQRGVALGGDLNIICCACDGFFLASYIAGKKRLTLAAMAQGNSVVHLYPAQLGSLILSFPALPEQQKIATFLGAVDAKLAALAAKQAAMVRYKAGLMQKLFSQQLRFTRDDGKAFPDWQEYPFDKIAFRTRSAFNPQKSREKPTLIELENIEGGTGKIVGHSDLEGQISLKSVFQAGDVLFGKLRPYLRKYAQPNFDGVCSSEIWVMRGRKVSNTFLFYLVQSAQFIQVANISTGSKMPRSDWSTIADTGFEIPHTDEQQKIANSLSAMDSKIQAVADQVTKLQNFKKGLLQQMFV
jgi:type I restriction enzyme S subunit